MQESHQSPKGREFIDVDLDAGKQAPLSPMVTVEIQSSSRDSLRIAARMFTQSGRITSVGDQYHNLGVDDRFQNSCCEIPLSLTIWQKQLPQSGFLDGVNLVQLEATLCVQQAA